MSSRGCSGWLRRHLGAALLAAASNAALAQDGAGLQRAVNVDVAPQKMSTALIELSKQAGIQLMMPGATLDKVNTSGVHGHMTLGDALGKLLEGTDLGVRESGPNTYTVTQRVSSRDDAGSTLLAQADIGQTSDGDPAAEQPVKQEGKKSRSGQAVELQAVVGSRIPQSAKDSAVPVNVYSKQKIDESGATSIADFLNTLPQVSVQNTTTGDNQQFAGATTVQLRGLPAGTTLVLLNGRRVESSTGMVAGHQGFFDLSSIPLGAIERIEVMPSGSSAIYGGDALGGVVNIVLKHDFHGVEASARYGGTDDGKYNDTQYTFAAGLGGEAWDISAIATYSENSELSGSERPLTDTSDYTPYGGIDTRSSYYFPGNICTSDGSNLNGLNSPCAAIPKGSSGVGLTPADFAGTAGVTNKISTNPYVATLAPSHKVGVLLQGDYRFGPWLQVFAEALYNNVDSNAYLAPPPVTFTVSASSPNNPFGQDLTDNYRFATLPRKCYCEDTNFFRPLLGLRGAINENWNWEVAGWTSRDFDDVPMTLGVTNTAALETAIDNGSFNPFQDGPGASRSVLNSFFSTQRSTMQGGANSVNGFVRGKLFDIAAGPVQAVIGGEYERDTLRWNSTEGSITVFSMHRESEAGFLELRVPIIGDHSRPGAADILAIQGALRYDRYSDFGGRSSPETGLEFRPVPSVLMRASYSTAFKPATLMDLYNPGVTYSGLDINDPKRGGESSSVDVTYAGNPDLSPETGWSRNLGVVWSPESLKGLDVSLTNWVIRIKNGFTQPSPLLFLNEEDKYPGHVIRGPVPPGDPYGAGPVTDVVDTYVNFGSIDEAGMDFNLNWRIATPAGEFTPTLAVTEVYRYSYASTVGAPPTSALARANDDANYTPRWKGTVAIQWKRGPLQAGVDGRYVGWYRDVTDVTANPRGLGNFWYMDLNGRYDFGKQFFAANRYLAKSYLSFGIRNLLDQSPKYADYGYGYDGYDPNEYDIEGRYLWVQAGMKF